MLQTNSRLFRYHNFLSFFVWKIWQKSYSSYFSYFSVVSNIDVWKSLSRFKSRTKNTENVIVSVRPRSSLGSASFRLSNRSSRSDFGVGLRLETSSMHRFVRCMLLTHAWGSLTRVYLQSYLGLSLVPPFKILKLEFLESGLKIFRWRAWTNFLKAIYVFDILNAF